MDFYDLTAKFSSSTENQRKAIFSTLFIAGNKLQTLFDNRIPEVSLKQFMLLSIVRQSKEQLTFTQLGNLLGCSRQNIKKLADSSKETASDSDANKEQIQMAISNLLKDAGRLIEVIDGVNLRVTNLAASTEEIAASADMVSTISADLKQKLDELNK